MKTMKYISILLILLVLGGCGEKNGINLSDREAYRYDRALQEIEQVEALCDALLDSPSQEQIEALMAKLEELDYDYNDEGMNVATMQYCDSLKMRAEFCQERALEIAEYVMLKSGEVNLVNVPEQLFTERTYYPVYLKKGETLFCKIEATSSLTARFYNADTERLIKSYQKSKLSESVVISNTGIYLLEIVPQGKQYASVSLGVRPVSVTDIYNRPTIRTEKVECKKGDLGAKAVPGVVMRKCFDEPRKFTLRGQLKAMFSGNAKALVAVPIPAGATDILYSMRIATSESSRIGDGMFHDNLTRSYKRIEFLGLPIYEKSTSNGLLNTLLDDNRPIREEDAYCNMYVFRNQSQAKQFQDGTKRAALLNYDVDYSTIGTQSCNGRIPTKGAKTIYLAFENERMRYTNYLWVEVETVVPNTVYYRTKYSVN